MFGHAGFVVPDRVWCTEGFEPRVALYLGLEKGTSAVHQIVEVVSDVLHPNSLLHFCKWDNLVPICISLALLQLKLGLTGLDPWIQPLLQAVSGNGSGVGGGGGIGQSFLISKRLLDIFPALGQGVPTQTGVTSKGEGVIF